MPGFCLVREEESVMLWKVSLFTAVAVLSPRAILIVLPW